MSFKEIEKYKTMDAVYYNLLYRLLYSAKDFKPLEIFKEAESQNKKIHLKRDRWKELFANNPTIDWEDIILREDLEIK
ncbi:hypothetical protein B6A10_00450 [Flavobacterium sp. L1I52]|uniref:Uncharacterized protein n=1 Tax=Flavobacterium pokkalii TaxID=1940408 RepID=A0ABR7ULX1_9FLAO|nr:hypothetical protein [Flavobacterium pokkalii]MBD0723643.1 hypothetical protein [Flavobacterium pokkalii]